MVLLDRFPVAFPSLATPPSRVTLGEVLGWHSVATTQVLALPDIASGLSVGFGNVIVPRRKRGRSRGRGGQITSPPPGWRITNHPWQQYLPTSLLRQFLLSGALFPPLFFERCLSQRPIPSGSKRSVFEKLSPVIAPICLRPVCNLFSLCNLSVTCPHPVCFLQPINLSLINLSLVHLSLINLLLINLSLNNLSLINLGTYHLSVLPNLSVRNLSVLLVIEDKPKVPKSQLLF